MNTPAVRAPAAAPAIGGLSAPPTSASAVPPAISALTTATLPNLTPSMGTQFFQALGEAPQILAQQRAQNLELADMQAQSEAKTTAAEDQRLAQIAQYAQTNPAFAQDPRVQATVAQIFKRRNLPAPVNPDGSLDVKSLTAATRPPPSPGEKQELLRVINDQIAKIANPAAGGPEAFGAFLKTFGPEYARAFGVDPSAMLDSPELQDALNTRVTLQLDALREKGIIHPQEEDRLRQELIQDQMDRFRATLGEKTRLDDSLISRRSAQTNIENAKLVIAQREMPARIALMQAQAQHYASMGSNTGGRIPPAVNAFLVNYRSLRAAYEGNVSRIDQLKSQGLAAKIFDHVAPGLPSLADSTVALKQQLDAGQDTYNALTKSLTTAAADAAASVSGLRVVPTSGGSAQKTITRARAIEIGKSHGKGPEETLKAYRDEGYTITP